MTLFDEQDNNTIARFSPCRRYRYTLFRVWGDADNLLQVIGLNPSTADETTNDNTLRKCIKFAKNWNFGALCMTNLFAFRATDPRVMKAAVAPVGDENDKWLLEIAGRARLVLAAWGNHGTHQNRAEKVMQIVERDLYCLKISKLGNPEHPLYQRDDTQYQLFRANFKMES